MNGGNIIPQNLQAACDLADRGIPVFPVRAEDKHPLVKWKTEATTDKTRIRRWWRTWPNAVPAFPTGETSGIAVLDIDCKDGKDGFKVLACLGIDPAALSTVIVQTASGGWHVYFQHKPGLPCTVGKKDLAGLDVRAARGFVVAPGAVGPRGTYSFIKGGLDDLADESRNLVGLAPWPSGLPMQARQGPTGGSTKAQPSGLPLAVLRDALMFLTFDQREAEFGTDAAWFKVARVIHDESGGSEEGNDLWHEWSDGWGGYDYHQAEGKWNREDIYDGERASIWAVLSVARRHGWTHPAFEAWQAQEAVAGLPDVLSDAEEAEIAALVGVPATIDADDFGTPMMQGDKPIINQHNAILYLGRNVESVLPDLRHNLMSHRDEWRGGEVADPDLVLARTSLERLGLKTIGKELVADAVLTVARARQYHPIRDDLARLRHDGKTRLDSWLVRYAKADDSPYVRAVGRKFLIQMVARIMQPGCKADHTLVMIGAQRAGKSSLCRILAGPKYFTDTLPSISGGRDVMEHLQGVWVVELSELAPARKSEAEDLKAFLTSAVDRFRVAYGKRTEAFPRQCVFIGTTNDEEFLRDATGGRRFWPVHVGEIDLAAFEADRDQLLAEAVAAYHAGEPWWLDPAFEAEHARPMQEAARVKDSWAEPIAEWLGGMDFDQDGTAKPRTEVTLSDVLVAALGIPTGQHTMPVQKRAGDVLRGLGWAKVKTMGRMVWRMPGLPKFTGGLTE
jgi:hypothetical protein